MLSNQNNVVFSGSKVLNFSIIIPTYNESANIIRLISEIEKNVPGLESTEIIVVDDNSPDGTGNIVENYVKSKSSGKNEKTVKRNGGELNETRIKVIHRKEKNGLIPAIMEGVAESNGKYILIMDADFSHPPEVIPKMLEELRINPRSIVVASRYVDGGKVVGWPFKRRLLSTGASKLARHGLNVTQVKDPMSGFFALPRELIKDISIGTKGYKILLEILVKNKGVQVKEIPYTFTDRVSGKSKMDRNVIMNYAAAVWQLYLYGQNAGQRTINKQVNRRSVVFLSKIGRYYTVGIAGLVINYVVSFLLANDVANSLRLLSNLWYIEASMVGIGISTAFNFFFNKYWTFEDREFSPASTAKQFLSFFGISVIGAVIQLFILYMLVENDMPYRLSLVLAVSIASLSNFVLYKKLTFREKVWA
ncbi:MAG: glycosyltransferase family 2 protein [Nitrososphaerota archaeon]